MGTAYTPGLTVSQNTVIRRQRRLPIKGEVLVTAGAAVTPEVVVARALPGIMQSVKVAATLGIEPKELNDCLLVKQGDIVEKGQVIAQTKSLFGLFKSDCKSPTAGAVETISNVSGNVGIRQPPIPIEMNAYISGHVAQVLEGEGVVIETQGALVQGIFGVGGERVGVLEVIGCAEDVLSEEKITPAMAKRIVVGGANITGAALKKASDIGVTGIVVGAIIDKDLISFLGYDIGVAITGHENINITLVITEGFGSIPMARRTFDLLKSLAGKTCSINGATQIRAGVIRPEVVVPAEKAAGLPAGAAQGSDQEFSLEIGTPIRVIRSPYFGELGEVTALPPQLVTVDSGASVRVLEAKLQDGRAVTVPRANVEIIQTG